VISGEQELYYDDAGIVGLKDGWAVKDGLFGWLNQLAMDCREIEERNPSWKAPVLRMGKWVLSNPSEWTHATSNWLDRAWKCYGEGVRDGTIERWEHDHEDWDEYLKDS
jgi:hypothetical protein